MNKFLHVGFRAEKPRVDEWTEVFNAAADWLRYAPNCWILYTSRTAESWFKRIKPHLKDDERVLICELNLLNRQGSLSQSAWDWIQKTRTK